MKIFLFLGLILLSLGFSMNRRLYEVEVYNRDGDNNDYDNDELSLLHDLFAKLEAEAGVDEVAEGDTAYGSFDEFG
jgi:hypothetical protein